MTHLEKKAIFFFLFSALTLMMVLGIFVFLGQDISFNLRSLLPVAQTINSIKPLDSSLLKTAATSDNISNDILNTGEESDNEIENLEEILLPETLDSNTFATEDGSFNTFLPSEIILKNVATSEKKIDSETIKNVFQTNPAAYFINPKTGRTLTGKIEIKLSVFEAGSVEFYAKKPESSFINIYLGAASQKQKNIWSYLWDTNLLPNSPYFVWAKIKSGSGEYSSSALYIIVNNETIKAEENIKEKANEEIINALNDSDYDGLSDQEEARLGTDPLKADTDQDGFLDGAEVSLGYDPLNSSNEAKIEYQDPRQVNSPVSNLYKVKDVSLVSKESNPLEIVSRIKGIAPPLSYVTIYIYSAPIIVVAKTDASGNWEYILDKPLAEGRHTVYAAVTNNKGELEQISRPYNFFVVNGEISKTLQFSDNSVSSPAENMELNFFFITIITIILTIISALIAIGIFIKKQPKYKY